MVGVTIRAIGLDELVRDLDAAAKELKLNRKKLEAEDCLRIAAHAIIANDGSGSETVINALGGNSKKLAAELAKAWSA
jgi:hypothetical protein